MCVRVTYKYMGALVIYNAISDFYIAKNLAIIYCKYSVQYYTNNILF